MILSEEEVRLFHRTSDLWAKHSTNPNHEKLIINWLELALVPGEEILFQFQYDEDELIDYTTDLEVRKGKFISLDNEEFEFGICIYYNGYEYTYSLQEVLIYHPVVYAYLSNL